MASHSIIEGIIVDEGQVFTVVELCEICVIERQTLQELIDFGIIEPSGDKDAWMFAGPALIRTQKALRLHKDLDINWQGVALALDLMEELNELRALLAQSKV